MGDVTCREDQIRPKGDAFLTAEVDGRDDRLLRGGELAALIEFPVVGQIGLDGDAEDPAPVDGDAAVEEAVFHLQGGADDDHRPEPPGGGDYFPQPVPDGQQQGLLMEEVLVGIGRDPQLREEGEDGVIGRRPPGQLYRRPDVEIHIGHLHLRDANGSADKAVGVDVEEVIPLRFFRHFPST